ncbi:MAG TPA: cyclic nucleotide-binding domain-containing protein [Stellaceae bacterium]|nr:cyclic nucleotide-binding domain-containing protein [Stellaceae bacterium]
MAFLASRAGLAVVLAFLLAAQNTYASTLAASGFLARVGAHGIPLYYILFAAVSIPLAALFSSVIDRFPRRQLFAGALGVFIGLTVLLAALSTIGAVLPLGVYLPYGTYLLVRVFEHLLYSIYYILIADHLTVLDNKRYAARIALGMAIGGLVGGGLLTGMTSSVGAGAAAWATPFLVAAVLVYAVWITRRQQPLDAAAPASPEGLAESLQVIPRLLARYPLVALMSGAMLLNVLLQCLAEFSAFSIYTAHFPRIDQLTVFLGIVNAGLSLLGFLVIVLFTGRQLPRLGVPKMNLVYPALDVLAFGALALSPSLPAGILANVSYDPFEHGIDVPVTTMNYNAIRHRFVGRVRVFIDGAVFPLGLAVAGLLLLGLAGRLDLRAIAAFGLALSVVLLALHWNIGKHYARGLVEMLRDGAVEFDQVESGLRLPPESVGEIRALLGGDARMALIGLEMAMRCSGAIRPAEIAAALAKLPEAQARRILPRLAASMSGGKLVEQLVEVDLPAVRSIALEHLLTAGGVGVERARSLLDDADERVRCVAAGAVLLAAPDDSAAQKVLAGGISSAAAIGALEVLRHAASREIAPILIAIDAHQDAAVRAAALAAAENCAAEDPSLVEWANRAAADPEPEVRRAALTLLARLVRGDRLSEIAERFLGDPEPDVRHAGAQVLGGLGRPAASAISRQLHNEREDAQIAAIDALGLALGPAAGERLFEELHDSVFIPIAFNRRLSRSHPADPVIRAAIDNAARRHVRLVMHALDALGHRHTLDLVRTMIHSRDERGRANAIESLASLPQRRFVIPILPLIEERDADSAAGRPNPTLIDEALSSRDPWIRAAAAVARHRETAQAPESLSHDRSPIVVETVRQLAKRPADNPPYPQEPLMSRLAFLHSVRLFAETSFDDLVAVDHALVSRAYLPGEPIIREGEAGDRLCIIYSGKVAVTKAGHVLAELTAGDFFGEMALFDAGPRSATVTALDDVEVLVLERDRFNSLVRQRPTVLMEVCSTLVRRLRQAEQQVLHTAS